MQAPLTTDAPWDLEVTSRRMRLWAIVAAVVIVVIHIFLAILVAIGDTGTAVTAIDQWGYFLAGLIFAGAAFAALWRPRIRANKDGVEVRNFIGTKFYPWVVIYGLNFPQEARIARLELPDFEYVQLWALQQADGAECAKAVAKLRELEAKYMPKE
ncbi:MAG: PH domain-containing protein [Corynebacterium sp.]|nr:PH domain-containing protein [Corynebacterium sp.]